MKNLITLLLVFLCLNAVSQSVIYKMTTTEKLLNKGVTASFKEAGIHAKVLAILHRGDYIRVNYYVSALAPDDEDFWNVSYKGKHGFLPGLSLFINDDLQYLKDYCSKHPEYGQSNLNTSLLEDKPIAKKKHSKVNGNVNFTTDDLGIVDLSSNPVNKQAKAQKATLYRDRMYKPNTTNLVQGGGINIDKADLDKYFPNGVDPSLSDAEIESRLEESKRNDLYKAISVVVILIFSLILWRKYRKKRFDPELIKQLSRYKVIIKNTAIVVLVIFIVICCLQVAFGVLSSIENALTQIPVWIEVVVFIGGLIIYFNLIPKAKE